MAPERKNKESCYLLRWFPILLILVPAKAVPVFMKYISPSLSVFSA